MSFKAMKMSPPLLLVLVGGTALISCNGDMSSSSPLSMADASLLYTKKTGDTMSGALNLPTDGLIVGTSQLVTYGLFVGIGTTAPGYPLHIVGPAGTTNDLFVQGNNVDTRIRLENVTPVSTSNQSTLDLGTMSSTQIRSAVLMQASFSDTTDATRTSLVTFRTTANGVGVNLLNLAGPNVGIGLTNPSYKLDVSGDVNASGCVRASGATLGGTCSSDERLKKDVQPFDLGLDALLGISPKTFRYNGLGGHPASDKPELGVIAQDVEKTAPGLVISKQVKLDENDQENTEIKQVNYTAFTYVLINAVKELYHRWFDDSQAIHRELASVKAENAELKARMDRLEQMLKQSK